MNRLLRHLVACFRSHGVEQLPERQQHLLIDNTELHWEPTLSTRFEELVDHLNIDYVPPPRLNLTRREPTTTVIPIIRNGLLATTAACSGMRWSVPESGTNLGTNSNQ